MRSIEVTRDNGTKFRTMINGTEDEIRRYYLGQFGSMEGPYDHENDEETEISIQYVAVKFLDDETL